MKALFLLPVIALAGCATTSTSTVKPADAAQVAQCKYIDDVVGSSSAYGMFAAAGTENARQAALARAEAMGATHIVWGPPSVVYGNTAMSGKAYRC